MRITIAHTKPRQQMIQMVDRAFDDAFKVLAQGAVQISNQQKSWQGSVMTFSMSAGVGFLKTPISGTVEVTDRDVTVDADIGLLSKLFPQEKIQSALETRLRGLLT